MEARTQKKNYFERIFSPKKRTDYRVDFLLSGNAYQSQTNHHHTLSWLLRTPLLHSSQMIISWVYLCPHISDTSSLWLCSLVHTEKIKSIRKELLTFATSTPVPLYLPFLLRMSSVLTRANRNTTFLVLQQTP